MSKIIKITQTIAALLALAVIPTLLFATPVAAVIIDRVVAEVNGEIITLSELEDEMATVGEDFLREMPAADRDGARTEARHQVLAGMIDRLLVEQQAAQRGILVGDQEVEAALARIMADNRLSRAEFSRELEFAGTNLVDYRRNLRAQILQSRLLNVEVRDRIVIPESRIKQYYQENYVDGNGRTTAYHILQLGFTWPPGDDQARDQARDQAEAARRQILAGNDFRELARELSELPSAADGGELGIFRPEELSGELRRLIPELAPGELTPVVELGGAHQFFKLAAGGGGGTYEEAKEEIREKLYQQALEERFERWVGSLREDAFIRIML